MKRISHWVGGRVVPGTSGREGPVFNPALGDQTAVVDLASAAEVDAAVASAKEAYPGWRATSLAKRAEVLFNLYELVDGNRKEIAALITAEHGKVLSDAEGEVARGLENVEFA
ncbi:MAG: aldehyde dehydrogenase family protein, partial [Acidimicrobiales bacterium]